jgi:uncharacterized RDD family membrane protein YckC
MAPVTAGPAQAAAPGLLRRLAAMLYDALALFGVLVVATSLIILPAGIVFDHQVRSESPWFRLYLLGIIVGYYAWPWIKGGQTLGMRAWRLRVVRADGGGLRLPDALLRLAAAVLSWMVVGLGFLWVLVDRDGLAWHDRLSRTRLVLLLPSKPKTST